LLRQTIAAVEAENMRCLTIRSALTAIGRATAGGAHKADNAVALRTAAAR
jgi:hypothetical protein